MSPRFIHLPKHELTISCVRRYIPWNHCILANQQVHKVQDGPGCPKKQKVSERKDIQALGQVKTVQSTQWEKMG